MRIDLRAIQNGHNKILHINALNNFLYSICSNFLNNNTLAQSIILAPFFLSKSKKILNSVSDKIENLVLACQFCNRKKSDFLISDSEYSLLYPDNEEIKKIFYRDEKYYIKIENEYSQNETIKKFYEQLEMVGEVRRLDFLLISLLNFKKKYRNKLENLHILNELSDIIEKLKKKRNII